MPRQASDVPKATITERASHARIVSMSNDAPCLDTVQLSRLEQSFREWVEKSPRSDVRLSRKRIFMIFLLIRYSGAKLNEVLSLDPARDLDYNHQLVLLGRSRSRDTGSAREVQIPTALSLELRTVLSAPSFKESLSRLFRVDPAHVRRKFYERASACGFPRALSGPDAIRKSRAVELMQSNMPLPVVQKILGHSTPNLTASYVAFSDDDIRQVARFFVEKESRRKTSARNSFFGKIRAIQKGDIQCRIELATISGDTVTTVITNDSLTRLGLKTGSLITAEVKAPWVILEKGDREPECSAENRFRGTIVRIHEGKVTTEFVVRIPDGTELCSIMTSESGRRMGLQVNDPVWVLFNSFSVVLHID